MRFYITSKQLYQIALKDDEEAVKVILEILQNQELKENETAK